MSEFAGSPPGPGAAKSGEQPMPSDPRLHAELLRIWKKILKTEDISIDDDFFEKGGDSLLAMDLHVALAPLAGHALPESILFEAPTIRELAKRLAR
jgi:hypothetical protein